jgi:hypothetical protein
MAGFWELHANMDSLFYRRLERIWFTRFFENWNIELYTIHMQNVSTTLFFLGIRKKATILFIIKDLVIYWTIRHGRFFLLFIFYNTIFFFKKWNLQRGIIQSKINTRWRKIQIHNKGEINNKWKYEWKQESSNRV